MGEQLFCKTLWNRCFCALAIASFQVLAREIQLGISVRDIRLLVKIESLIPVNETCRSREGSEM